MVLPSGKAPLPSPKAQRPPMLTTFSSPWAVLVSPLGMVISVAVLELPTSLSSQACSGTGLVPIMLSSSSAVWVLMMFPLYEVWGGWGDGVEAEKVFFRICFSGMSRDEHPRPAGGAG